jgi:hypothetical protein
VPKRARDQITGGEALAEALTRIAPKRVSASPTAMFRAMERSGRGREYLADAGVNATTRTQLNWLTGESTPNAANQRAIRSAYDKWAGANARNRTGSNQPGSTPIEIYPGAGGSDQYGRPVKHISITDAQLGRAIELSNRGDTEGLNSLWDSMVDDQIIDSPPGKAYRTVSHVFIGG